MVLVSEVMKIQELYDWTTKCFAAFPLVAGPASLFVDAPFGRFALKEDSIFLVNGIKSWIVMEAFSPLICLYTYMHSPLSLKHFNKPPNLSLSSPSTILLGLFLVHYLNRALISPLRTPSRSKSHISVTLFAIAFNIVNGALIGSYLSSPEAEKFLTGALSRPLFWTGIALWALGFAGNIVHDEILLNIRRNAKAKGKAKAEDGMGEAGKKKQEHYAIPHGYLYSLISYPNYFCEWVEWLGFALAAAPLPTLNVYSPPWVFVYSEVLLMLPRAYKGHKWYHEKFPDYPKERKAAIPFIL